MKRIKLETAFDSTRQQYHLIGASGDIRYPRQRWYDSHSELVEAVQSLNPSLDIS